MQMKIITWALLVVLCGCSRSATISRASGEQLSARIERSDQETIYVKVAGGREVHLARSEVADIDHPGNGVAVLGGLLSAYGAANIALGAGNCGEVNPAYCVGVFLPAAVGVSMLVWGLNTWFGSTDAASNYKPRRVATVPTPPPASAPTASEGVSTAQE